MGNRRLLVGALALGGGGGLLTTVPGGYGVGEGGGGEGGRAGPGGGRSTYTKRSSLPRFIKAIVTPVPSPPTSSVRHAQTPALMPNPATPLPSASYSRPLRFWSAGTPVRNPRPDSSSSSPALSILHENPSMLHRSGRRRATTEVVTLPVVPTHTHAPGHYCQQTVICAEQAALVRRVLAKSGFAMPTGRGFVTLETAPADGGDVTLAAVTRVRWSAQNTVILIAVPALLAGLYATILILV